MDHEDDRVLNAPYCGWRIEFLYENEWHTGKISYYNNYLKRYIIFDDDNTEDYIGEDDIDMVEVCVV